MFDAKNPQGRAHPKRQSQLQTYTEMRACETQDGNRERWRKLSGTFTAPKLKLVTLLLRVLFCLCNITERFEHNRSAKFKHG